MSIPILTFVIGVFPILICGPLGITKDRNYKDFVEKNLNATIDIFGHNRNDGIDLDYYKCVGTNDDGFKYDWCKIITHDWDELQDDVSNIFLKFKTSKFIQNSVTLSGTLLNSLDAVVC